MLSTSDKRMNKEYHETQNIEGKTKKLRTMKLSKAVNDYDTGD
jgi:hypothetical protein